MKLEKPSPLYSLLRIQPYIVAGMGQNGHFINPVDLDANLLRHRARHGIHRKGNFQLKPDRSYLAGIFQSPRRIFRSERFSVNLDGHLGNIDVLRIAASLSILVFHIVGLLTVVSIDDRALEFAVKHYGVLASGVDLFFVISGFVIFNSLRVSPKNPFLFIKGRIRRIVPTYWFLIVLTLCAFSVGNFFGISDVTQPSTANVFYSLTFATQISNNFPPVIQQGWSLEYEMVFYLIVAISLSMINLKKSIVATFILLAVISLFYFDYQYFMEFGLGILVAVIFSRVNNHSKVFPLIILILSLVWYIFFHTFTTVTDRVLIFGIPYSGLLFACIKFPQINSKYLRFLGQVSYPLYLVHGLVTPVIYQFIKSNNLIHARLFFLILILGIGASTLLAAIIQRGIDLPASRYLKARNW